MTCEDVDECADESPRYDCEQTCVNEIGGYRCACRSGFKLVGGVSCLPLDAFAARSRRGGGLGVGGALLVTVTVVAVASLGAVGAYRYVLKRRIDGEVRAIMADYMPLEDRDAERGPGRPEGFELRGVGDVRERKREETR